MEKNKVIELKLNLDMINVILSGLGKLPLEVAYEVFTEMHKQAKSQLSTDTNLETNLKNEDSTLEDNINA